MADFETGLAAWLRERRRPQNDRGQAATVHTGLAQPESAPGRSESVREYLQRTPHRWVRDLSSREDCVCGLILPHAIHCDDDALDTRAYLAALDAKLHGRGAGPAGDEPSQEPDLAPPVPDSPGDPGSGSPLPGTPEAIEAQAAESRADTAERAPEQLPDGVLGYLVACFSYGRVTGTTHTTLMGLGEARKEAKAYGVSPERSCFPVELRQVDRD